MSNNQSLAKQIALDLLSSPNKDAIGAKRFFKTGEGDYAFGDVFIGVKMPRLKELVKKYSKQADYNDIIELIKSEIHEQRALALLLLVDKFAYISKIKNHDRQELKNIVDLYISPQILNYINNWDLVDISCYKILGAYIVQNPQEVEILYTFAKSDNLWIQRIAIVSTMATIRSGWLEPTIDIAKLLLNHRHDLIHKATGWLLRELGKKDEALLVNFLQDHSHQMSKTTISYARERLNKNYK